MSRFPSPAGQMRIPLFLLATMLVASASNEVEIPARLEDRAWPESTSIGVDKDTARIGTETVANSKTAFVMPFLLPSLPEGMEIDTAEISIFVESIANPNSQTWAELRGGRVAATATTSANDAHTSPVLVPKAYHLALGMPVQRFYSFAGEALSERLREIYQSDPLAAGQFVFFAVAPDKGNSATSCFITVSTANSTRTGQRPVLRLTLRPAGRETTPITHNGITWQIAGANLQSGQFVTGDPWVVGPITIVEISNDLNSPEFTPRRGQNGTMINPLVGHSADHQGYDDGLSSYREVLNAGLPNGGPISPANKLVVPAESTIVSAVSWLYRSSTDREPGAPNWNASSNTPRPAIRSMGVLTVLSAPPPPNAFRPPYAGSDKSPRFLTSQLRMDRLQNLSPPATRPNPAQVANQLSRPWVDHVYEFLGAMIHPSEHMPDYGRDMATILVNASLLVHLDFSMISGAPPKSSLLVPLIQFGIDTMGVVANGGGFPANGGHHQGRFWPVLFAGLMLDDPTMMDVGRWGRNRGGALRTQDSLAGLAEFQDFQQYFYVTPESVALANSPAWNPDPRGDMIRYTSDDVGMPEWGIRHSIQPQRSDRAFITPYRSNNSVRAVGFALAARIMGAQALWNHDAYFDYADRYMTLDGIDAVTDRLSDFVLSMWNQYHESFSVVSYNSFLRSVYSPAEIGNPSITGPSVVPPGAKHSNWKRFFFNGTRDSLRFSKLPQIELAGSTIRLRYETRMRPPNFNAGWMTSQDQIEWTPMLPLSRTVEEIPSGGFRVTDELPGASEGKSFFRLETRMLR